MHILGLEVFIYIHTHISYMPFEVCGGPGCCTLTRTLTLTLTLILTLARPDCVSPIIHESVAHDTWWIRCVVVVVYDGLKSPP